MAIEEIIENYKMIKLTINSKYGTYAFRSRVKWHLKWSIYSHTVKSECEWIIDSKIECKKNKIQIDRKCATFQLEMIETINLP